MSLAISASVLKRLTARQPTLGQSNIYDSSLAAKFPYSRRPATNRLAVDEANNAEKNTFFVFSAVFADPLFPSPTEASRCRGVKRRKKSQKHIPKARQDDKKSIKINVRHRLSGRQWVVGFLRLSPHAECRFHSWISPPQADSAVSFREWSVNIIFGALHMLLFQESCNLLRQVSLWHYTQCLWQPARRRWRWVRWRKEKKN